MGRLFSSKNAYQILLRPVLQKRNQAAPCGPGRKKFLCARRIDTYRRNSGGSCMQAAGRSRKPPPHRPPRRGERQRAHRYAPPHKGRRPSTHKRPTQTTTIYISYRTGAPPGSTTRSRCATDRRRRAGLPADLSGTATTGLPAPTRLAACPPRSPAPTDGQAARRFPPPRHRQRSARNTTATPTGTAGAPGRKAPQKATAARLHTRRKQSGNSAVTAMTVSPPGAAVRQGAWAGSHPASPISKNY